jgi:hypothetical protein
MKTLYILLLISSTFLITAQAPAIDWQKTLGGNQDERIRSIISTADGGYVFGSYTASSQSFDVTQVNHGATDYWIVKTNTIGTIQWQKCIGGSGGEGDPQIVATADGGYIVGADSTSNISGNKTENCYGASDYWVVKLDSVGNVVWDKTLGGINTDTFSCIVATNDGGCLVGGTSRSNASGNKTENIIGFELGSDNVDYWVVKLNAVGGIEWQNTIGGYGDDRLTSIVASPDGGYLIGGFSVSGVSGDKTENNKGFGDYWILKLDAIGNILWDKTIGGDSSDRMTSIINTNDNGFLVGGYSTSGISGDKTAVSYDNDGFTPDYWVVKLGETGNIIWQRTLGGLGWDQLTSLCQDGSGNFLIGGGSDANLSFDKTENSRGGVDFWMVKLNSEGTTLWDKTLGGAEGDAILAMTYQPTDNSFILAGNSLSSNTGDKTGVLRGMLDIWIVKLEGESLATDYFDVATIQVYPNPTAKTVYIDFAESYKTLKAKVHNLVGQLVSEKSFAYTSTISIDLNGESGVYFIEIENEFGKKHSFKVIKK